MDVEEQKRLEFNEIHIQQANKLSEEFIHDFFSRFGTFPTVTFNLQHSTLPFVTLEELEVTVDYVISKDDTIYPKLSVRNRTRKRPILIYRQCLFKIALSMGYTQEKIAFHFGWDRVSILHSRDVVDTMITIKNKQVMRSLSLIEEELKSKYGTKKDIRLNIQASY